MSSTKDQVKIFLQKCDELKSCKFIMATTKIKDLLKSIVNSPELYMLFKQVTENFDYVLAKRKCLITVSNGVINKNYVILPDILGERLAFIFCLLAEFDNNTINFNNFLQTYYTEDGSYYLSYLAFCEQIIKSLEEIILEVFKDEFYGEVKLEQPEIIAPFEDVNVIESSANPQLAQKIQEIYLIILKEQQILSSTALSDEDKNAGLIILSEIVNAVKNQNMSQIRALLSGYNYFALYNNCISENFAFLIDSLAIFGSLL